MSAVTIKMDEILALKADLNTTCVMFLKVHLETALLLSGSALRSTDLMKRERTRRRTLNVYRRVERLAGRVQLTDDDAKAISDKLQRLRSELLRLEEYF